MPSEWWRQWKGTGVLFLLVATSDGPKLLHHSQYRQGVVLAVYVLEEDMEQPILKPIQRPEEP